MTVREMFSRMTPRSIVNLLTLNLQTILSAMADNIFSAWIPLFLAEVHNLKFKEMGFYASLPLLGGALGGAQALARGGEAAAECGGVRLAVDACRVGHAARAHCVAVARCRLGGAGGDSSGDDGDDDDDGGGFRHESE